MRSRLLLLLPLALLSWGCSSTDDVPPPGQTCGALEVGDKDGHADPFGAKAAGEARAARLKDAGAIAPPAHGRQGFEDGDFILINDKIAVVIEDGDVSDGYGRFGGEIPAVDTVDSDGMPAGKSQFIETLMGIGLMLPNPTSVSVLADGSDGGAAIVRTIGKLEVIPFLSGAFAKLFKSDYDLEVAYDYVLAPGAENLLIRVSILNTDAEPIDFGVNKSAKDELYGFFQTNHSQLATPSDGFGDPAGESDFAAFAGHEQSFAWRAVDGPMQVGLSVSGFYLFHGTGFIADGCAVTTADRAEVIVGGPYYDGLRETIRRVDGADPWRAISGTLSDADGTPMAGAWVHVTTEDDVFLSRTKTGQDGSFTVHGAPDEAVQLTATTRGYVHDAVTVGASEDKKDLQFEAHATIVVTAEDTDAAKLPVRVQLIPKDGYDAHPAAFGVRQEAGGRLHQEFTMNGEATLIVPPGEHRVVVSRGYEYELHDETITVAAGETGNVTAVLEHSVDSTGVMCADFHIHSFQSADSPDPIDFKVRGAVADGLDIPVSSEHEWVVDFGPVVEKLGVQKWAFGMASSELTTFSFGHFGVVPLIPKPGSLNNGAIDWLGKLPEEVFALVDAVESKPALIINHPRGGIGGYFSSVLLDDQGVAGNQELWSDNFDAIEVFNDSDFDANKKDSVEDWFALLNTGMKVSAVGSSDTHKLRTSPAGYPRTCMPFGHDDTTKLTASDVRDEILEGSATISGGLLMTVAGPNEEGPGEEVASGKVTFDITVQGPSWIEADELEAYVDGEMVASEKLTASGVGTANVYTMAIEIDLKSGSWVVFHAKGTGDLAPLHPGRKSFAVSNPIFAN